LNDSDAPLAPAPIADSTPGREAAANPASDISLDFEIAPQDIARLLRAPALLACRQGRARVSGASMVWHDTAGGDLAARGLSLGQARDAWRLERLRPNGIFRDGVIEWPPATVAPIVAQGSTPGQIAQSLNQDMPEGLTPIAAFTGRLREYPLRLAAAPARLAVLEGTLRGVAQDRLTCHVIVTGQATAAAHLAAALCDTVRLTVPRAGLAAQAIAVATGQAPSARRTGAPSIPPGTTVAEAIDCVVAHLADVILHWASLVPGAASPEPLHQMRVGVRRLRSALSVFRRAAQDEAGACPWLDELAGHLKPLASRLGHARDWDVFIDGTGEDVAGAFPKDRRIAQLNAAASRKREAAYADLATFFASRAWAKLEMTLALLPSLRPWRPGAQPGSDDRLALPIRDYAADALKRRLKSVLTYGADLSAHEPAALHELRKQAKRLRYAIEFFSPLFAEKPVRKYLPRLEELQEELGTLNDRAVAAALMDQLGGGTDRAFAAGVVMGFGAARNARATARIQRAWEKLTQARPFWTKE